MDKGSEISLNMNDTVVKAHTDIETNYFSFAETSYVSSIMALKTKTILYTDDLRFNQPVLVKEMPKEPLRDDHVATAPTSAPTTQNSAPTVPTTPTSVSTAPPTPVSLPQAPTAPTANPQPTTPSTKKRAAATGGKPGNAKRGKAGACS